jgi:chitosanase
MGHLRSPSRAVVLLASAVLGACAADTTDGAEPTDALEQDLSSCQVSIVTNTYKGSPDYWGTIAFKNTGSAAMKNPSVAFTVPSGVKCDHDEPGWKHTQSGATCTYSRTSDLSVAAGSTYTFQYSTNSASSFKAGSVSVSGSSCGAGGSGGGTGGSTFGMGPHQKAVAEAITSIWENDTPKLDYAYSENIHDGRGYTSGRAGFCTGTGDAILVIQCYDKLRTAAQGNVMAKYMPALVAIDKKFESTGKDQGSTAPLDAIGNWPSDWAKSYDNAATRADFEKCQDQIVDELYYTPAMKTAEKWGLVTALSKAALYDAFINHGEDGVHALVKAANSAVGNSAQVAPVVGHKGITEDAWLQRFLEKRRDVLAGDSTWVDAIDRVAGYEKQRRRKNWDFSHPVENDVRAKDCWPGKGYKSSGYTVRIINPDATWSTPGSHTYSCN